MTRRFTYIAHSIKKPQSFTGIQPIKVNTYKSNQMEAVDITSNPPLSDAEKIRLALTLFSDDQTITYDRLRWNSFDMKRSGKERCAARHSAKGMVDTAVKRGTKYTVLWDPDVTKAVSKLTHEKRVEYVRFEIISKSIFRSANEANEAKAGMHRLIAGVVCNAKQLEKYDERVDAETCRGVAYAKEILNRAIDQFNINNDPKAPLPIGKNPWENAPYQPARIGNTYVQPEGPLIDYKDIETMHTVNGRRVRKKTEHFSPMENFVVAAYKRGLPGGTPHSTKETNPANTNEFRSAPDENGKRKRALDSELKPEEIELRNTAEKLKSDERILAREAATQKVRDRMTLEGFYVIDGTRDVVRELARQAMDESINGLCAHRWRQKFPDVDGNGFGILQTLKKREFMFYIGIHSDGDVTEPALCEYETCASFTMEDRYCIPSNLDGTLIKLSEWRQAGFTAFNLMQFKTREAAQWAEEVCQVVCDEVGLEQGYKIWRKTGSGRIKVGKRFEAEVKHAAGGPDAFTSVFISMVPCGEPGFNTVGEITSMRIGVLGTPGAKRVAIRPPSQKYVPTVERIAAYKASIDNSLV
jgi:hypothetical protein